MINDNTIVKVKVPKHLYEAIQKKLALKEAHDNKGKERKKPHTEMKKSAMHGVYKEGEDALNEDLMNTILDIIKDVDKDTAMMILTVSGVTGLAKFIADKIKGGGSDVSGITGAEHG